MKKTITMVLLLVFSAVGSQTFAQDEKPADKIFGMLNKGLSFTPEQTPKAQSLAGDFTKQFMDLGKKQMMGAVKQKAQDALFSKFTEGLGKFITPTQLTKFKGISNTVKTALLALK
jgi:hypothetical protein